MTLPLGTSASQAGNGGVVQRLRLWSGLVLMVYALMHFINHSLGHISLEAMQAMLFISSATWGSVPGNIVLYGALGVHLALGSWKILSLRTLRLPLWQWAQILLGVAIPFLLVTHIIFTRGVESQLGLDVDYTGELAILWPAGALQQNLLLLLVWVHGIVGLHFWLRIKDWYPRWLPLFAAIAVLIPVLAMTGWMAAARREAGRVIDQDEQAVIQNIYDFALPLDATIKTWIMAFGAFVIFALATKFASNRFRKHAKVDYGNGKIVNATPGQTLLEVSRSAGIPHMSVCGGRARCSTCRTLIVSDDAAISPRTGAEDDLLQKINAAPNIRLACQAKVHGNLEIRPLVQPQQQLATPPNLDPLGWGVEREVAILFLDIRGFSRISEKSLPYDIVFILNSFFAEITSEIESANGFVDKFMGDGLMAIFGLTSSPAEASRDALIAAANCQKATASVSRLLTQHLAEPIRIGIGIHTGQAIIGRIGKTADQKGPSRLTAVGDSVNIAARLESATKELKSEIVFSKATLEHSRLKNPANMGKRSSIKVHNISTPIEVIAVKDTTKLANALDIG